MVRQGNITQLFCPLWIHQLISPLCMCVPQAPVPAPDCCQWSDTAGQSWYLPKEWLWVPDWWRRYWQASSATHHQLICHHPQLVVCSVIHATLWEICVHQTFHLLVLWWKFWQPLSLWHVFYCVIVAPATQRVKLLAKPISKNWEFGREGEW